MADQKPKASKNTVLKAPDPAGPAHVHAPQRTTPALLMSIGLHFILLTTLGLIWSRTPSGTGESNDRQVGIAIVHQMPDREKYVDAAQMQPNPEVQTEQSEQSSSESAAAAAPPADMSPPIDLAGILHAMESTPAPVSGTGLSGETDLTGDSLENGRGKMSSGTGSEATTMVFGVSGSGSRFVYVFDRSDSMNGHSGRPLRAAKAELIRSLKSLTEKQRFQIIFYNDKPKPFQLSGAPLQLISGEQPNVVQAERYVQSIAAFGGTKHDTALKLALQMSPDVIFFLTDARIPRLSGNELRLIKQRAEKSGTTIHTIEFGPDAFAPNDSFLRDLAKQNNGQYQYVDVRNLGRRPLDIDPTTKAKP